MESSNNRHLQHKASGDQQQQEEEEEEQKRMENSDGTDLLELASFSRIDLINLVRETLANEMKTSVQLAAANKEAAESAKMAKELATQFAEFKRAFLASQQKVGELSTEMANRNVEYQKQFEELSQRITQLEREKEELRMKLEEAARKKREILELPLETWADLLAFVPRYQLVKVASQIWHRKFAKILQFFLHECGAITLGCMRIAAPDMREDSTGRPIVINSNAITGREIVYHTSGGRTYFGDMKFKLADTPMPGNVKNFQSINLSYFDMSVINFLQEFQRNSLLENINLELPSIATMQPILPYFLPLICSINSIRLVKQFSLSLIYNAEDKNELGIKMLAMARILIMCVSINETNPRPFPNDENEIDFWCRWLYTPRDDGRARMLFTSLIFGEETAKIINYCDRIKQDFLMSGHPISFFIHHKVPSNFQFQNICLHNGQTNEKLKLIKYEEIFWISRYPMGATNEWIWANEKEAMFAETHSSSREIGFNQDLKIELKCNSSPLG